MRDLSDYSEASSYFRKIQKQVSESNLLGSNVECLETLCEKISVADIEDAQSLL